MFVQYIDMLAHMKPEELKERGPKTYAGYLLGNFPAELTAGDLDIERLRTWYGEHEEYFGPGKDRHATAIDSDLVSLKLSNRKPAFLDWLVERLGKTPDDELALRLAARYLGENGKDAPTALAWIQQNRPFLFFSDAGGYHWFVDTNAQRAAKSGAVHDATLRK